PAGVLAAIHVSEEARIARNVAGDLPVLRLQELLFLSLPRRLLLEEVVSVGAPHAVDDAASIREPDRGDGLSLSEGEARVDAAGEVPNPDVVLSAARVAEIEGQPVAPGRQRGVPVLSAVAGGLQLAAAAVLPEEAHSRLSGAVGQRAVAGD